MAGSFSNSWTLVKASANVLKLDKELLVFPLMSGIATILVTASFVAPLVISGGWRLFEDGNATYLGYVGAFLFYLVQYAVIFFFNSALVGAALIRLAGGDPTVGDGLAIASKRLGTILGYAAIAATVGMVLRMISERSGFLGQLAAGLVGMAWSLASYLVVPVLVTEDIGPIDAVKKSGALLRRTWGEQVVGNFGLGWAMMLMGVSWTLASVLLIAGAASLAPAAALPALLIAVLGYILLALFSSALKGVYTAALYSYATTGESRFFDPAIMGGAFRAK